MIEVAKRSTSTCPRCGSQMIYMSSLSQLQLPDESGKHVSAILNEIESTFAQCTKCRATYELRRTVYGLLPTQMAEDMHLGSKDPKYENYNPIGKDD